MLYASDLQVASVVEEMTRAKAYLQPCVSAGDVEVLIFLST
jgi:hypothetical protein